MYTVLARKYRPATFNEVCGQKHITKALQNAIKENRVAHAYLFSGQRGTGKTSIARIFAKTLNCEKQIDGEPCQKCSMCKSISAGSSLDVLEIDGASNRGIEEIRALRENVNLMPAKAPFKIYIIDEAHMLTTDASNALLKTLEEPPSYVKFILATTSPEKIIPTISSRCQKLSFRPLSKEEILFKLEDICNKEKIKADKEALQVIFEFSGGSLRDALSILDQLIVNSKDNYVTLKDTREFLGVLEDISAVELLLYLRKKEIKNSILMLHKLLSEGKDPALILDELVRKIKLLVIISVEGEKVESPEDKKLSEGYKNVGIEEFLSSVTMILEYRDKLRISTLPIVLMEVLFFKLSQILGIDGNNLKKESSEVELFNSKDVKVSEPPKQIEKKSVFQPKEKKVVSEDTPISEEEEPKKVCEGDEISTKWDSVLLEVKEDKPTLVAALREGVPTKIGEDELKISFGAKYGFHKSKVEEPKNKKIVEEALLKTFGKPIKIIFYLEESVKNTIINDKEVKKIIDFFNGEIVKLEE